jgi:hypothetical protein
LFKPGQSGNPRGKTSKVAQAQAYARDCSLEAMETLRETMINTKDDRVRVVCANALLDRALGKPKEIKIEEDPENARRLEIKALMANTSPDELLALRNYFLRVRAMQREADSEPEIIPPGQD